jgi:hypothetical protein
MLPYMKLRITLSVLLSAGGIVVACSGPAKHDDTVPAPLGLTTAPGPSNPSVPPPDSAGVPNDDQPVKASPPSSLRQPSIIEVAEREPMAGDAGVVGPVSDGGVGSGSGSGSGPKRPPPGVGSGAGSGSGAPGAPPLPPSPKPPATPAK